MGKKKSGKRSKKRSKKNWRDEKIQATLPDGSRVWKTLGDIARLIGIPDDRK
jgi:hypothetical protein